MLDAELIDMLVCPETKQPLRLADDQLLEELNASVGRGELRSRGGTVVARPLDAALVREDGHILYPIRDEIPIILIDESIELDAAS